MAFCAVLHDDLCCGSGRCGLVLVVSGRYDRKPTTVRSATRGQHALLYYDAVAWQIYSGIFHDMSRGMHVHGDFGLR